MKKNQIDIVTMGCSKNLVDSETLMKLFEDNGYHCVHDPKRPQGEIAVINTCGFIASAIEESVRTLMETIDRISATPKGKRPFLAVAGCLVGRYGKKVLAPDLPEVDLFLDNHESRGASFVQHASQTTGDLACWPANTCYPIRLYPYG